MNQSEKRQGLIKVFLSSTFKDLKEMRKILLDQLFQSLDTAAMEYFVSSGRGPQSEALKELRQSKIAIFLISPYYGSDIRNCECMDECSADCGMKDGTEEVSYTLCEYRTARSEYKLCMPYIIDEGWNISEDGAPKVWNLRREVERDFCPRIKKDEEGIEKVIADLFKNIIDWYSIGEIDFENFCGRRDRLGELVTKMKKSVNVYGVGGIGKTTLCEVALLLYRLLGKKTYCVGSMEAYASGTGYEGAYKKLTPHRVKELTLDDIVKVLELVIPVGMDTETKIDIILHGLERDGTILFIDDFKGDKGIKELIRKGNRLHSGCILVSTKKELRAASYRVSVKNIEENERGKLIEIMASRIGKKIKNNDEEKIREIAEGHPIATYLLISNIGRVPMKKLVSFKEGLDFSQDDDVKEYMNRVIKSGISPRAYELLKDLSVIEEEIDIDSAHEALSHLFPRNLFGELVDASILERTGSMYVWIYNQIKEAVFEDVPKRHRLAMQYYRKKLEKSGKIEDEIEMLYHAAKVNYFKEIASSFINIADSLKREDPVMRLLPKLGEEIIKHVEKKEVVWVTLGNIYWSISNFKDKFQNCRKAIKTYNEALNVFTLEEFPIPYAAIQLNIGNAYSTLAEVEDKAENCKKAIQACKEALKIYTLEKLPIDYAMTQTNIGNAYRTLAEVEDKAENCKKAIQACKEALKIYTLEKLPIDYAKTQTNIGIANSTLAEVEDKAENCKKAIRALKEALKIFTYEKSPMDYAKIQNNLGNTYRILAEVEDKAENCKKAIQACKEALKERPFEKLPIQHVMTQVNIGNAYRTLAEVEDKAENCKKAIQAFEVALKIFTYEKSPMDYAKIQNNLGTAYGTLAEVEDKAENCKKAIQACKEALKIYTLEKLPIDYAMTQNNLGILYGTLAEVEDKAENCKKAIQAFKEAFKVFKKKKFPKQYQKVDHSFKKLLEFCKSQ